MKQVVYYVSEKPVEDSNAGSKARNDIEIVLKTMGLAPVAHFETIKFNSFREKLDYKASPHYLMKIFQLLKRKNSNLILQYPFYYDFITNYCLKKLAENNNTLLFIHDVDALRAFANTKLKNEIDLFNHVKLLITHNDNMSQALREMGVRTQMFELNLFDYILNKPYPSPERILNTEVVYAGNLSKSLFLQNNLLENIGVDFILFGNGFSRDKIPWKNVYYKGSLLPDDIPYHLKGSFGLIWDGESIKTCSGNFGSYMRYNNPHKLSLYISACLPVITWQQAAIADFIQEHKIGFCVNSLDEIKDKIYSLTEEDYNEYLKNVKELQKKVVTGTFTKCVMKKALSFLLAT